MILRINAVEVDLRQVAVKISPEDLAAGIEAITAQAMLQFGVADLRMVELKPAVVSRRTLSASKT